MSEPKDLCLNCGAEHIKYTDRDYVGWTGTWSHDEQCPHDNGWYVIVTFWVFKKRVYVCSDCGEVLPREFKPSNAQDKGPERSEGPD